MKASVMAWATAAVVLGGGIARVEASPVLSGEVWEESTRVRFDGREGIGGRMVHGVEWVGEPNGDGGAWVDTREGADGWREIAAKNGTVSALLALNGEGIAMEGGRLEGDTEWGSEATHVVRHWVVVPSGAALTVGAGAVVKMVPGSGIRVEDGGRVHFAGTEGNESVVTGVDDAEFGVPIDCGAFTNEVAMAGGVWQSGAAMVTDDGGNVQFRFNQGDLFPTVSLQNGGGKRSDGVVRIPVTVGGTSRSNAFRVDWEALDGNAVFGEDYLTATGTVRWAKSEEGTKTIEIPVNPEAVRGFNAAFTVRLTAHYACNTGTTVAEASIREFDFPELQVGDWMESVPMRFDGRGGLAGALVHGEEWVGEPDGSTGRWWNTVEGGDGWSDVVASDGTHSSLLALNAEGIAIEGGRLAGNTEWTSNATHVVRHTVVVPNGVTLTVGAGAVVKFLPGTVIRVEDGGKLAVNGAEGGADAVLTSVQDGRFGAAIDCGEWARENVAQDDGVGGIVLQSSAATYTDNEWTVLGSFRYGAYPYVKLNDTVAFRDGGMAYVPVSIESGSRSSTFSVDWVAVDGTAKLGEDYTLAGGTLTWTGTGQGTKTLQIPLVADRLRGETTSFTLKLSTCRTCNASGAGECTVTIRELGKVVLDGGTWTGGAPVRFDGRASLGARIVHGTEWLGTVDGGGGAWMNTGEWADGWREIGDGGSVAEVLSLNAEGLAVEGGRLAEDTIWGDEATHVVRHWVVVPNGKTLTLTTNAVAKICPDAGIRVENGGKLVFAGADGGDVIVAQTDDDSVGVPLPAVPEATDLEEGAAGRIVFQSGNAAFEDNGWFQIRDVGFGASNYGSVEIHGAEVSRKAGMAWVAVTVGGNARNQSFAVDWEAVDGTAAFGRDYLLSGGRLTWEKSSEGTKWIQIPLNTETATRERRRFTVRLKAVRGMSGTGKEAVVEIREYEEGALSRDDVHWGTSGTNESFVVDEPVWKEPMFRNDEEPIRLSGAWQQAVPAEDTRVRLSWSGGDRAGILAEVPGGTPAIYTWKKSAWPVGSYVLQHDILTADGKRIATYEKTFAVPDLTEVVLHGGPVRSNETWQAGGVHVVYETVQVPALYTLMIEPGAIVKFLTGTGIDIESGGGALFAQGVVFTHINDDTIGGDTLNDGAAAPPVMDAYTFIGDFTIGDECELRCKTQVPLSGTISASRRLTKGSVYRVSGNVTVAGGATLTIPAGTVLKFDEGVQLAVSSGATLLALGTRAAPVVFTSVKDDEHGGDTNGDGDASYPVAGDWACVKINGGTAHFSHAAILYSSRNQTTGAISMDGGTVVFDSGEIAHGLYDAVGVERGDFHMTNSVIRDCLQAFRHWAQNPIVNCVIHDCGRLTQGGGQTFVNCVFSDITETWEAFGFPKSTYRNCCFWNEGGSVLSAEGAQDALTVCGTDGNVWGDPKFLNPDNGDFAILEGSACIDAADSALAPKTDVFGQKRWTWDGTSEGEGAAADIGVAECLPRGASSDVDLAAMSVACDRAKAKPGETVFLHWTIANEGGEAVDSGWWDELALVSASGRVIPLGEKAQTSHVAAGGVVTGTGSFEIPAVEEGVYGLRLHANHRRDVAEGTRRGNNVRVAADALELEVDTASAADGASGSLSAGGTILRKFVLPEGSPAQLVRVTAPNGTIVRYGLGSVSGRETGEVTVGENGQVVFAVPGGATSMYLALDAGAVDGPFDVVFEDGNMSVSEVDPSALPGSGKVTLRITGAGFAAGTVVTLLCGGNVVAPVATVRGSAEELWTTVDCASLRSVGTKWGIRVECGEAKAELPVAFSVGSAAGAGRLRAQLVVPASVRKGYPQPCRIVYANDGNADLPSPILQVRCDGGGLVEHADGRGTSEAIQFIGAGGSKMAGILRPGEERWVAFRFRAGIGSSVYLYSSEGQTWCEEPWACATDMLADFSSAATRIGLRGQDATDYKLVRNLAVAVKHGEPTSVICGRVVDKEGAGVQGTVILFTNITGFISCLTDKTGRFCTTNLAGGAYFTSIPEFTESMTDVAIVLDGNTDTPQQFVVDVKETLTVMVNVVPESNATLMATYLDGDNETVMPWRTEGAMHLFRGLAPGCYSVECCLDSGVRKSQIIYLEEEVSPSLEFDFSRMGALEINFGSIDTTIARFLLYDGVEVERMVTLNGDNFHAIEGLPVGDYTVLFHVQGTNAYHAIPVSIFAGCTTKVDVEAEIAKDEEEESCGGGSASTSAAPQAMSVALPQSRSNGAVTTLPPRALRWTGVGEKMERYTRELLAVPISVPQGEYDCIHNRNLQAEKSRRREELANALEIFVNVMRWYDGQTMGQEFFAEGAQELAYKGVTTWILKGLDGATHIVASAVFFATDSAKNAYQAYQEGSSGLYTAGQILLNAWNREIEILKKNGVVAVESANKLTFINKLMLFWSIAKNAGKAVAGIVIQHDVNMTMEEAKQALENKCIAYENILEKEYKLCELCRPPLSDVPPFQHYIDKVCPTIPQSIDPNEVVGPAGTGDPETERFVVPGEWLDYTIYFENATNATASAVQVRVTEALSEWLDWDTLELGEVVFANRTDPGLAGKSSGTSELEVPEGGYRVRTSFSRHNGVATWHLRMVDPDGDEDGWPTDPYVGFLPPNDEDHNGEGHVSYRIRVREDAPKNVRIDAAADIVFDWNESIATDPSWWNRTGHPPVDITFEKGCDDIVGGMPKNGLWRCDAPSFGTPVREGWLFGGWKDEGGTIRNRGADLPYDTAALTLRAEWLEAAVLRFAVAVADGAAVITGMADGEACPAAMAIPASVEVDGRRLKVVGIGDGAFAGQKGLAVLKVSEGVQWIGARAFQNCVSLARADLPSTLERIGEYAFFGCPLLSVVSLGGERAPESEVDAFRNGAGAGILEVPGGAEGEYGAWVGTVVGTAWVVAGAAQEASGPMAWTYSRTEGTLSYSDGAAGLRWVLAAEEDGDGRLCASRVEVAEKGGTLELPECVEDELGARWSLVALGTNDASGPGLFEGLSLRSVQIPESVETMAPFAFADCAGLTNVAFAGDAPRLKDLGDGAFFGCVGLRGIPLARALNLARMGSENATRGVFESCWNLESVELPDEVEGVGAHAFEDCSRLRSVRFEPGGGSTAAWIGERAFYNCDLLEDVDTGAMTGLKRVGAEAFGGESAALAPKVRAATLHRDVESVGDGAFGQAGSLAEITCHAAEPPIRGADAFRGVAPSGTLRVRAGAEGKYRGGHERAWVGEAGGGGKLPEWNGSTGWRVVGVGADEELRERNAYLGDEEYAAFAEEAERWGFGAEELCGVARPAEALDMGLRVADWSCKGGLRFSVVVENGIDATAAAALRRLKGLGTWRLALFEMKDMGGAESELPCDMEELDNGTVEMTPPTLPSNEAVPRAGGENGGVAHSVRRFYRVGLGAK